MGKVVSENRHLYINKEAILAALGIICNSVGSRRERALRTLSREGIGLYKRVLIRLGCTRSLPSQFPCSALRVPYTMHHVRLI